MFGVRAGPYPTDMSDDKTATEPSRIIGVDPGVNGALALLEDGALVDVADMPCTITNRSDGRIRRRVDAAGLSQILARWQPRLALVEMVHASPGMGVGSAFSFGHTAGTIEATLTLAGCDVRQTHPSAWKRAMGVPADKAETVASATDLFGAAHWPRKKDHGRAEAALIALYGHRLRAAGML